MTARRPRSLSAVDPADYYFRLFCRFEVGDRRYQWLNRMLVVAAATRTRSFVHYEAYSLT
jgi:hypothetical protein